MLKEMATHSSILAWRIPWMEELGGLQSTGHKELGTTERLHFHLAHAHDPWYDFNSDIHLSDTVNNVDLGRGILLGNCFSSVQFSSVAQSCLTLCNPMNCSTPGLPVHQQLPEFTQLHVYRVSDAIQPSHPLLSPSPPAPNPSQHQSLFQWVNASHEVAKVLEFQL